MHRSSFSSSSIKSDSIFELLHMDIWGPYKYSTYNGYNYFLTIVDDFSRATWTHLFSHKYNAFDILKSFISFVQTQFQTNVKIVRTNNGMEFCDTKAQVFYSELGLIH